MKKVFLFTALISGFAILSAFKTSLISECYTSNITSSLQREQTVVAYMWWDNNWRSGNITYIRTQQGYTPVSYNFGDTQHRGGSISPLRGYFSGDRFVPLNPNNELAKKNNWTHIITVEGIDAYLTLY